MLFEIAKEAALRTPFNDPGCEIECRYFGNYNTRTDYGNATLKKNLSVLFQVILKDKHARVLSEWPNVCPRAFGTTACC